MKKTRLKTVKRRRTNAFLPVPVEPLPEPLQQAEQDPFPAFQPPFRIDYVVFQLEIIRNGLESSFSREIL
jgi:hypothetical protein